MKKEQLLEELVRRYRESDDSINLYATRIREESKTSEPVFLETDIQTIKQFVKKKNFKENELLEKRMNSTLMSVAPILISFPKKDAICIHELDIQLQNKAELNFSDNTKALVTIFDNQNKDVIELEKEIKDVIHIPLKKLKTGMYYWTIDIDGNTKTGRFYHCSPLDAAILRDAKAINW